MTKEDYIKLLLLERDRVNLKMKRGQDKLNDWERGGIEQRRDTLNYALILADQILD